MVPEILLLEGVREKNRSHWYRTFPFHFGLYLLVGATVCLIMGGLALAFGYPVEGPDAGTLGRVVVAITPILGYAGLGLGLLGGLALLLRRLLNRSYREYTHTIDFFSLLFFIATFAVALGAQITADPDFSRMRAFFASLLPFGSSVPAENLGFTSLQVAEVVLLSLLAAWVPLTHMSHFFTKWFMYHQIRWSDEPLERGGKIERQVDRSLTYKPTWSAPHIRGDGTKTWVDIATSPAVEKAESEKKAP
jgi:nitrate reductase gamma subunit